MQRFRSHFTVALIAMAVAWGTSVFFTTSDAREPDGPAIESVPEADNSLTSETGSIQPTGPNDGSTTSVPAPPKRSRTKPIKGKEPAVEADDLAPSAEMPRPPRVGRIDVPPVPETTPRPQEAPPVAEERPLRVGRLGIPTPSPKPPSTAPVPVEPPQRPKRAGGGTVSPSSPAPAPEPVPTPPPAPKPAKRVELVDITYRGNVRLDPDQVELFYETAEQQLAALLPKLESCGIEQLHYDINVECTTRSEHWQHFSSVYMFLNSDGKIYKNWSNGCIGERLVGEPMPIGKTHHGQWQVSYKVLRRFKPNPEGGPLCPYKGLME